jgi:hypothetical protein
MNFCVLWRFSVGFDYCRFFDCEWVKIVDGENMFGSINWPPELCSAGSFYSDRIRVQKKLNPLGLWRRKDVSVAELIRRVN